MPQYHVYKTSPDGEYKVIDTTTCQSVQEIDVEIALAEGTEIGAVNWYGTKASSPEEAIKAAINEGYQYASPERMKQLLMNSEALLALNKIYQPH